MELSTGRRGTFQTMEYLDAERVLLTFELPLAEVIVDFYDQLKSRTPGLRVARLRGDRLPRGRPRPAGRARRRRAGRRAVADRPSIARALDGRVLVERLTELIPRQMFEVPVQAAIGSNVIARETIRAMRKNVLAKCYGGDITRKRKLLEKQKAGKARMKRVGSGRDPAGGVPGRAALERVEPERRWTARPWTARSRP